MIEFDFYFNTSRERLREAIVKVSKDLMPENITKENSLVLPSNIGLGKIEFFELEPGLSLIIANCSFSKTIRLNKKPDSSNYFYSITCCLNADKLQILLDDGKEIEMGGNLIDSVLFNSDDKSFTLEPRGNIKLITIVFDRPWIIKNFSLNRDYPSLQWMENILNNFSMQFAVSMDLMMAKSVKEILTLRLPNSIINIYLKGAVISLISLFIKRIIEEGKDINRLKYSDVEKVKNRKEEIEKRLPLFIPAIADSAKKCTMGRTKFQTIFKTIYGKDYTELFTEMRLTKALELLKKGIKVTEVSCLAGFVNCSHFIKIFKMNFNVTPKEFQKKHIQQEQNSVL